MTIPYQPVISNPTFTNYIAKQDDSASASQLHFRYIPIASGIQDMKFNLFSSLDFYSLQIDELNLIMLASEQVLSKEWNTPEEDEAWANL